MKKVILATAIVATISAPTYAEGVIGNQLSISAGYPFYEDQSDYSGFNTTISADYFLTDTIYLIGDVDIQYLSTDEHDQFLSMDISTSGTQVKSGLGLGYEMLIADSAGSKLSVYGEGRVYLVNVDLDLDLKWDGGESSSHSSEDGSAFEAEVGARAMAGPFLSEVGVKWETIDIDDNQDEEFALDAMVAYQLSESLYLGLDTSIDLDSDYTYLGGQVGFKW